MAIYKEKRSKHALAMDRKKNAEVTYMTFNKSYRDNPSKYDVQGYDTKKEPKKKKKSTYGGSFNFGIKLPKFRW